MHLKDINEVVRFEKNSEDVRGWFSLFQAIAPCGCGDLNLKEIIKTAQKVGVKHFFVEQDIAPQSSISLK